MAKQQHRKPVRRKPKRPIVVDNELAELALILDEHRLENSCEGWFELPWRNGWNAARLGLNCWRRLSDQPILHRPILLLAQDLHIWTAHQREFTTNEIYETAGMHLTTASALVYQGENSARPLSAGFRCVQLVISNSSGGGYVYNDVLKIAFKAMPTEWPHMLEDQILAARCKDAIGVNLTLCNDKHDRLRRAFAIAWKRGLYHAAYSLPRVKE